MLYDLTSMTPAELEMREACRLPYLGAHLGPNFAYQDGVRTRAAELAVELFPDLLDARFQGHACSIQEQWSCFASSLKYFARSSSSPQLPDPD
jgi:hypothetical protein